MLFYKNEDTLLKIIKFGPILFVITLSFIFTQLFINIHTQHIENDIKEVKREYLKKNKLRVKEEVDRTYNNIQFALQNIEEDLKKEVTNRGEEAFLLATKIYQQSKKNNLNDQKTLDTIKKTLRNIIYDNGKGYYFIIDSKGTLLLQPLNRDLENKNVIDLGKRDSIEFTSKVIDSIKNKKDAYHTYFWHKAQTPKTTSKKLSYSKYFKPFNFMIGTGKHLDDYEKTIQKRLLEQISNVKFNDDSFIFIYHLNGDKLTYLNRQLIGKKHSNDTYPTLENHTTKIVRTLKDKEQGFVQYTMITQSEEENINREKVSYIREFKKWNWIISSGFYLDKIEKSVDEKKLQLKNEKEEIIETIIFSSFFITLIFIVISFIISKILSGLFSDYKKNIQKEIKNTIEKEKMLIQQSRLATMGEMIANIAHQWKQPLSIINMAVGSIQINKEFDTLTDEEIDTSTKDIEHATSYLSETIDDFKNFFNPNKEKKYFSTVKLIDKMFRLLHSQYKNNNIEVVKNIENIELYSYENELLQVLINILNNARDELIEKDKEHKKLIFIDIYSSKETITIKIKDNANGIPNNIIKNIFDSHFTTKIDNGGTGIGLYMSQQIVENSMSGTIKVENVNYDYKDTDYNGAEFTITLHNDKIK